MKKERKKRLRRLSEKRSRRKDARSLLTAEGIISMNPAGFGFVKQDPELDVPDIFIPAQFVNGAIDGDLVRVEILPPRGEMDKGPAGRVREILERSQTEFTAELLYGNRLRPLNPRLPEDIFIHGAKKGAKKGDWVKVRLDDQYDDNFFASVIKVIGKSGIIASDLDAIMAEFGLEAPYSEEENQAALAVTPREIDTR